MHTSFDEFFLAVSQRVEMKYIFSDNIRILYLSWYVKSPKDTVNCQKRAETSVVLIVFDCVLCQVRAYKLIIINAVTVSYRRSTWIRYQKTISWSITKYNKTYPVNATAQIEQDKNKTVTGRRRNTNKTSCVSILRLPSFYLY
jgi:hypothetical protein